MGQKVNKILTVNQHRLHIKTLVVKWYRLQGVKGWK